MYLIMFDLCFVDKLIYRLIRESDDDQHAINFVVQYRPSSKMAAVFKLAQLASFMSLTF